ANVASIMLARAHIRKREFGIRAALGANRLRLMQQLLTESLMLSGIAGLAGLLIATWGTRLLGTIPTTGADLFTPYDVAADKPQIDVRVLLFTLTVSLITGLLFGLAPAVRAAKPDLNESLKEGSVKSGSWRGNRARSVLVIGEVALSMILVVGAGLLMKSF